MNTIVAVCVILVTLAIVIGIIFAIRTLVQIRRTAREAETLLKSINAEINTVMRITGSISAFIDRFSSPWVKVGSWFTGIVSSLMKKHRQEKECDAA
jgi:uncharacterized membrane protein SirB2